MKMKIVLFGLWVNLVSCESSNSNLVNKPDQGTGDCYDRVTNSCNNKLPGKNWGDKEYRDCINGGFSPWLAISANHN